jgi:hypothetical protein
MVVVGNESKKERKKEAKVFVEVGRVGFCRLYVVMVERNLVMSINTQIYPRCRFFFLFFSFRSHLCSLMVFFATIPFRIYPPFEGTCYTYSLFCFWTSSIAIRLLIQFVYSIKAQLWATHIEELEGI